MLTFERNPYSFGENSQQTNTPSVSIEAFKDNGEALVLDRFNDPIEASINTGLQDIITETVLFSPGKAVPSSFLVLNTDYALRLVFTLDTAQSSYTVIGNLNALPTAVLNIFSFIVADQINVVNNGLGLDYQLEGNVLSIFVAGGTLSATGVLHVAINATTGNCSVCYMSMR